MANNPYFQNVFDNVRSSVPRRIAFFGGSFDPIHRGHYAIARALIDQFELDRFVFIPAFHAPHKTRLKPTSAYDRYTMICLLTAGDPKLFVSKMEIQMPERPYSVETLARINADLPDDRIFFVMGADSWMDIKTWREWESVLTMSNHIVMTRPNVRLGIEHVTDEIRGRIIDLRNKSGASSLTDSDFAPGARSSGSTRKNHIYITDTVNLDVSATMLRRQIRENMSEWKADVPQEVANYIEKYQIYR